MLRFNRLEIDASDSITDLCRYGAASGTDKSPYSSTWHHHPYTAVYDLLFASMRYKPVNIGEVGILDNKSFHMWRDYFAEAKLFGFEFLPEKIAAARSEALPGTWYGEADVSQKETLTNALNTTGVHFDILIDDSTHVFDHQILFAEVAIDFVKPGGLIIIEDVFRGWDEKRYATALSHLTSYFSLATFVDCKHAQAYSGGTTTEPYFDNDKLLILYRNTKIKGRLSSEFRSDALLSAEDRLKILESQNE